MSALIRQFVSRKRIAEADAKAFAEKRDQIVDSAKGEQGEPGPVGPMPAHEWKGTKLRFEQPDGKWGKFKDLKGPKGEDGQRVVVVGGGGGQFNPTTLGELPGGVLPSDFLLIERNGSAYRVPLSSVVSGGDEVAAYSKRTDFISPLVFYRGEAAPGTATSAAFWRVALVTISSDGDVSEVWAGGTSAFDKVWDDRDSLSYS